MSTETTEEARKARSWVFVAVKVKGKDDAVKVNGETFKAYLTQRRNGRNEKAKNRIKGLLTLIYVAIVAA